MPTIQDPPLDDPGTFGHEFNYSVWTPGTTVTLCNVPWNSDYRDIVSFDSQRDIDSYLDERSGPSITFTNMTYAKVGHPVRIDLPFNDAYSYNYLRVRNSAQPVGESGARTFYYFVRDVRFIAPNTTELDIQLDVWQTFGREIRFGNCFVERGHIGIANENQMVDNGREYLAIPEGLDVGGEYQIQIQERHTVGAQNWENPASADQFGVLVLSTVNFAESGGTVEDPKLQSSLGTRFEGLPNGAEAYYFSTVNSFVSFVGRVSTRPWVSQGIIGVYAVPVLDLDALDSETVSLEGGGGNFERLLGGRVKPTTEDIIPNWRDEARSRLHPRYRHLSKFLTHPYTTIELTSYSGVPLSLKPESLEGDGIRVGVLTHLSPPSPRIVFYPYRYNASALSPAEQHDGAVHNDGAEFLDMMTGIFNLPTFSVTNNGYMSFLASNANSIPYQQSAADWSQQRALQGNQLGYDQASRNMAASRQGTEIGIGGAAAQTDLSNTTGGYRAAQSGVNAIASGARGGAIGLVGGAIGAANAGVGHAIDVNHRNQSLAINSGMARAQNRNQLSAQGFMRDTNKDFADYAAQGDYEMALSAINAKVQDAKMIQPTTSGQMGGDAFNMVHYRWAIHAKVKMVQRAAQHAVGEFWLRYGYRVGRFTKPPASMKTMSKFTYWKLRETYITSSECPESFRQSIRGIFEKGVTVWNDPRDIGNIDIADNEPLSGVRI